MSKFLAEQGLADRRGQRVVPVRDLWATLCGRELAQAAKEIVAETEVQVHIFLPLRLNQEMKGFIPIGKGHGSDQPNLYRSISGAHNRFSKLLILIGKDVERGI